MTGKFAELFKIMRKDFKQLFLQNAIHETVQFGAILAVVGGYLDAYTYITRGGVFSNAQTGNIVLLGVYAAQRDWGQALAHIPPILAFICGVIAAKQIKNHKFFSLDAERKVLIFECIVLIIIGFMQSSVPDIIVTVTVSFAASVQVSSFRKLVDAPYNTTMSTGNLRSAAEAAYIAVTRKDFGSAVRAFRYFSIIFSFILGGFVGGMFTMAMGTHSIWIAAFILASAIVLISICGHKSHPKKSCDFSGTP